MAMACGAMSVASLSALSIVSSSLLSLSSTQQQASTLHKGYDGLGKSFQARLVSCSANFASKKSASVICTSFGASKGLVVSATADPLPLMGNVAPDFEDNAMFDQDFIKVTLSNYKGKKYVVIFFYPLDFTFVCPIEITAFSDKYAEFEAINTKILGVSTDSKFSHLAWIQTKRTSGGIGDLNYPLVADVTKKICKAYNVLVANEGIAHRGLFIIDKEGVIQHATINNMAIGRSVEEMLHTLQAIQYVQENPDEVCPARWKPGEKTMKLELSKEYSSAIDV